METYYKATKTDLVVWPVIGTVLGFGLARGVSSGPVDTDSYAIAAFGLVAGLSVAMIVRYKLWAWIFTWLIASPIAALAIGHIVLGWGGAWMLLEMIVGLILGIVSAFVALIAFATWADDIPDEDYTGLYDLSY